LNPPSMPLKGLPADARPREKLLQRGPAALSDAELLALLLRTGIPGKNVVQLAQELVDRFGGVAGLLHSSASALQASRAWGRPNAPSCWRWSSWRGARWLRA